MGQTQQQPTQSPPNPDTSQAPSSEVPTVDPYDPMAMQDAGGGGNAAALEAIQSQGEARGDISGEPRTGGGLAMGDPTVGEVDGLPQTGIPSPTAVTMAIRIHHDFDDRLEFAGTPDPAQLYTVVEGGEDECPPDALPVLQQEGSVEQPWVSQDLVSDALYRGGGPTPADVQQGYIGDCYLLAVVSQVANQDPGRIRSDLSLAGGNIGFTFKAFDPGGPSWVDEPVSSSTELAFETDGAGNLDYLKAAGILADPLPINSFWWVHHDPSSSTLTIMRDDEHEAAMWVAYLEKLYLMFVETHGQYGDIQDPASDSNPVTDPAGNQQSGYDIADGGFEHQVYQVFYGSDVVRDASVDMQWDPTDMSNTVVQNKNVIRRLLQLGGEGIRDDRAAMMTVWADSDTHIDRFKTQIEQVLAADGSDQYPSLLRTLRSIVARIDAYTSETDDTKKERRLEAVARAAERLAEPGNWPLLHEPSSDKMWHDLLELASDVQHTGSDTSDGTRMAYSGHAYSVMGASFVDTTGAAMALDPANLDADLPSIDPERSTVEIRNPHHTNEPDLEGDGPADGEDDGRFDMTLDQFFRNYTGMDIAVVDT